MTNGSLMKFESIADVWTILQYFWPALRDNWSWKPIFGFLRAVLFTQVLLYKKSHKSEKRVDNLLKFSILSDILEHSCKISEQSVQWCLRIGLTNDSAGGVSLKLATLRFPCSLRSHCAPNHFVHVHKGLKIFHAKTFFQRWSVHWLF